MLRYAGILLVIVGLAALASMSLMDGSVVYRSWISQSLSSTPVVINVGNKTGGQILPPCRVFSVSSCFKVGRVKGVKLYMDFSVNIPSGNVLSSQGVWGYLLDCKLLQSMSVAQNMSQFLNKFSLAKVKLRRKATSIPLSGTYYEGQIPLENLTGRKIFAVIYGKLKASPNQSCLITGTPTVIAIAHPELDQKIRTLYLMAAGALLLALHYIRNPEDIRELVERIRSYPSRLRRRSSPP